MRTTASWGCGILANVVKHPAHRDLGIVIAIELLEHLADLHLRKSLGVEAPHKALEVLLLIAQKDRNLRMEVAVAVAGYAELQTTTMAIGMPWTKTFAIIPVIFR